MPRLPRTKVLFARPLNLSLSLVLLSVVLGAFAQSPVHAQRDTAAENWQYTALGDSLAYGVDDQSAGGYVPRFRAYLQTDTGASVTLNNQGQNGWTSSDLLNALRTNTALRHQIAASQVVTFNIGGNDFLQTLPAYRFRACGGADNQNCLRQGAAQFKSNFTSIVAEITALRSTANTIIRTADVYNPFVNIGKNSDTWAADGGLNDFQVTKPYIDDVNDHIARTAYANGISVARVYQAFNGANGDIDPADRGLIASDGVHANDAGHKLMADLLRRLGYTPLQQNIFISLLTGSQQVPSNNSQALGFGLVFLSPDERSASVTLRYFGLQAQTAAHIHAPSPFGLNAGVLFDLPSGSVTNYVTSVTPAQVQQLKNGLWYFDAHTQAFPNGEIRGQIVRQTNAPELRFANPTYTVNESAGVATVSVVRVNDTSNFAAVEYQTDDRRALIRCNEQTGIASSRCDYTTSTGVLIFTPGESSKTFSIPLTNDAHVEGAETFSVSLRRAVGATLGSGAATTISITDADTTANQPNPINAQPNNNFFVRQHYLDFLGRNPATSEISTWTNVIQPDCPVSAPDTCYDRIWVSGKGFFQSQEFQAKGYYVYRLYKATLGRLPTYGEFIPDMTRVPGTSEADKTGFAAYWMTTDEYNQIYGELSNADFVAELERRARVTLAGRAQITSDLDANRKTRAQVLREVVELPEIYAREFNEAWVVMQYFGYLRRDGAPSEYQGWLNVLNNNPNDWRTMINGFVNSIEYRNRFGQP